MSGINRLSTDCLHSSGINIFKKRINNCLVRAKVTFIQWTLDKPMQPSVLLLGWQSSLDSFTFLPFLVPPTSDNLVTSVHG